MESKKHTEYRFKEDFSFNDDIYGIGQPHLFSAKAGDSVLGYPSKDKEMDGMIHIQLSSIKSGCRHPVGENEEAWIESSILEEIK